MKIGAQTRLLGVLGWPVGHSLSPRFQNRFLAEAGIDAVYLALPCPPERLAEALAGLHAIGAVGLNVTVPHKQQALRLAVDGDDEAAAIGAANTLIADPHGWRAANTDWIGFLRAAERLAPLAGETVVLFGAGGAARAAAYGCARAGVARLIVLNRTPARAEALAADARRWGIEAEAMPWTPEAAIDASRRARWVVNASSAGLDDDAPFPLPVAGDGLALDLVYRPDGCTPFVRAARAAGRRAEDGLAMLVEQGAASFARWFDRVPDAASALDALMRALDRPSEVAA